MVWYNEEYPNAADGELRPVPTPMDIRKARHRLEMTQAEVAEECGLEQSTVSRIEQGNRNARMGTVQQLVNTLRELEYGETPN